MCYICYIWAHSSVAERIAYNGVVVGSNPTEPINFT